MNNSLKRYIETICSKDLSLKKKYKFNYITYIQSRLFSNCSFKIIFNFN